MIRVESPRDQVNIAKVYEAGQEQIFEHWDELSADERSALLSQIAWVDFQELTRLTRTLIHEPGDAEGDLGGEIKPAQLIPLTRGENGIRPELQEAIVAGTEALRRGEVGVFLVAGGQGSRLQFEGPKGLFPIGPITDKSLFQIHAENLLAVQRRYKVSIPWIIMTSEINHEDTERFFKEHAHFGLNAADVYFVRQGMLPVVDLRRGKMLLATRNQVVLGPNGHGGAAAVIQQQAEMLRKRGVKYLFYHQVDNPMLEMCDPAFIGYHIVRGSQFSSKAVPKSSPEEKVGVFCEVGGRLRIVEYTELEDHERYQTDASGRLLYRGGNIANHVVSLEFFAPTDGSPCFEMPYHVAKKATAHLRDGEVVEAKEVNSIKFESFLFDVLPYAENPIVLETSRREFAPVKNFEGQDSPAMTRKALIHEWGGWLQQAGIEVPRDDDGEPLHPIEISPLFADNADLLRERIEGRELDLSGPLLLE